MCLGQGRGNRNPLADQGRIWEPFYRVRGTGEQNWESVELGVGLYLCRTIIEWHYGQVGVQSAPGDGSTFWFTLPLAGKDAPAPLPREHRKAGMIMGKQFLLGIDTTFSPATQQMLH